MLGLIKKLFSSGPAVNYAEMVKNGAQIIDVRTRQEYAGGNIKGSVNIPLNELQANLKKIKKGQAGNYLLRVGYAQLISKGHTKVERIHRSI